MLPMGPCSNGRCEDAYYWFFPLFQPYLWGFNLLKGSDFFACFLTGFVDRSLIYISAALPSGCHTLLYTCPSLYGPTSAPRDRSGTGMHKFLWGLSLVFFLSRLSVPKALSILFGISLVSEHEDAVFNDTMVVLCFWTTSRKFQDMKCFIFLVGDAIRR